MLYKQKTNIKQYLLAWNVGSINDRYMWFNCRHYT
jgi:hypothetical protein